MKIVGIIKNIFSEGAPRPTAGDEPCEFTSHGEGGRVPPFIEKLQTFWLKVLLVTFTLFSLQPIMAGNSHSERAKAMFSVYEEKFIRDFSVLEDLNLKKNTGTSLSEELRSEATLVFKRTDNWYFYLSNLSKELAEDNPKDAGEIQAGFAPIERTFGKITTTYQEILGKKKVQDAPKAIIQTVQSSPPSDLSVSPEVKEIADRFEVDLTEISDHLVELKKLPRYSAETLSPEDREQFTTRARKLFTLAQNRFHTLKERMAEFQTVYPTEEFALAQRTEEIEGIFKKISSYYHREILAEPAPSQAMDESTEIFVEHPSTQPAKEEAKIFTDSPSAPPIEEEAKIITEPPAFQPVEEKAREFPPERIIAPASQAIAELGMVSPTSESKRKVRLTGKLSLEVKKREEEYTATKTSLPNDVSQGRLTLQYVPDPKNRWVLENKAVERKRNELVKENALSLNYLHIHSPKASLAMKDTFTQLNYPENPIKNFRDNAAAVTWNKKEGRWERLYQAEHKARKYPGFSRSNFKASDYQVENTLFIPNGTIFSALDWNSRSYSEAPFLDYNNKNLSAEYNQSFTGNKSEVTVTETYDTRDYDSEAVNLFRAGHWDNYLTFRYELPINEKISWVFEDDWQTRRYPSDEPRGYAQVRLKSTAKVKVDPGTRARLSHQYILNDEETPGKTHSNHIFSGFWEKRFTENFKTKVEDTYHHRASLLDDIMDFKENVLLFTAIWKLPSRIQLTWKNELLDRTYTALHYPDYKYFLSGLGAYFSKMRTYDVQAEYNLQNFSHRNGSGASTKWKSAQLPSAEAETSIRLNEDLKLRFFASKEKTYYKNFDTITQELLWDFSKPMIVTEYSGGLDYEF